MEQAFGAAATFLDMKKSIVCMHFSPLQTNTKFCFMFVLFNMAACNPSLFV